MKRTIAIASASALLVVGTAFVVHAQTSGGIPACADITGGDGVYTAPREDALGVPEAAGKLTWTMNLAAKSCPDVQYGLTVYLSGPPDGQAAPILASAMTPGDTISSALSFELEVNTNLAGAVCVVATAIGGSGAPTDSKNGAAFDADGSGSVLLDRDPDGPAGGDLTDPPVTETEYCVNVDQDGSGGRTAG